MIDVQRLSTGPSSVPMVNFYTNLAVLVAKGGAPLEVWKTSCERHAAAFRQSLAQVSEGEGGPRAALEEAIACLDNLRDTAPAEAPLAHLGQVLTRLNELVFQARGPRPARVGAVERLARQQQIAEQGSDGEAARQFDTLQRAAESMEETLGGLNAALVAFLASRVGRGVPVEQGQALLAELARGRQKVTADNARLFGTEARRAVPPAEATEARLEAARAAAQASQASLPVVPEEPDIPSGASPEAADMIGQMHVLGVASMDQLAQGMKEFEEATALILEGRRENRVETIQAGIERYVQGANRVLFIARGAAQALEQAASWAG